MNLSNRFTLEQFTQSDTAKRLGIDNSLPISLYVDAKKTANFLEGINRYLADLKKNPVVIEVTSGYRCLSLNRALGSKDTSDHIKMMAIDFRAPIFGSPLDICKALLPALDTLGIGQMIYEHTWVHVSRAAQDKPLNRVLTVQAPNSYLTGIVAA